jgi:DNA-binding transcriptional LysR family regulator
MDLDSALLRAFVTTAEERHFGRAAERMYLSQQALSKRIQRLEALLAVRLLDRTHQRVDLTAAGERLLPHARRALDGIDAAVAAVQVRQRALVVDVIDEHLAPLRLVDRAAEHDPGLALDVTMRQTTPALATLRGGAADVAFGRAGALGPDWPEDVLRRLVLLERIGLLAGAGHRFADRGQVTLGELCTEPLWFPLRGAPGDWTSYLPELAGRFGLQIDYSGTTRGFPNFLKQAMARPTFIGMAMGEPPDPRVRVVPIMAPAPVFAWWAMWTRRVPAEFIDRLTTTMVADLADDLVFAGDPQRAWLPDADRNYLMRDAAVRRLPAGPALASHTVPVTARLPPLLAAQRPGPRTISQRLPGMNKIILVGRTDRGMLTVRGDDVQAQIQAGTGIRLPFALEAFPGPGGDIRSPRP